MTVSTGAFRWIGVACLGVAVLLPPSLLGQAEAVRSGTWLLKLSLGVTGLSVLVVAWLAREGRTGQGFLAARPAPGDRVPPAVIAGILLAGLVVRLVGLNEGLWFDEIQTYTRYLTIPLPQILTTFDSQNQHMFYSILARGPVVWLDGAGWASRVPAVLFGVGGLWATYWFGCMVTSRREAAFAAAFLAVSYHHVWFSQNARGYTGLLFFTLLSTGLFLQLLRSDPDRSWRPFVLYVLTTALGVYTHATAAVVGVAHFVVWLWLVFRRRPRSFDRVEPGLAVILAGMVAITLYAVVLPQFIDTLLEPTMGGTDTEWKNPLWLVTETLRGLAAGVPGGLVGVAAGGAIFATGLVSLARERVEPVILMCLPGVILVTVIIGMGHNLWPRLVLFSAGFGVLIVMRGIATAASVVRGPWGPRVAGAVSVLAVVGSAATLPSAWNPKQDFRGAMEYIEAERRSGDVVATVDMTILPYRDYLETDYRPVLSESELAAVELEGGRTWLVYVFDTRLQAAMPEVWERLQSNYRTVAEFPGTVLDGEVVVMVNEPRIAGE